jgi:hypothetical protein
MEGAKEGNLVGSEGLNDGGIEGTSVGMNEAKAEG